MTILLVGSDEVSALVVDIGTSSIRAGYAGDDTPKAIIPTSYGFKSKTSDDDVSMAEGEDGEAKKKDVKLFLGQHGPSIWRDQMEIGNPVRDGLSVFCSLIQLVYIFNYVTST
jgi:actin-like protein 6A